MIKSVLKFSVVMISFYAISCAVNENPKIRPGKGGGGAGGKSTVDKTYKLKLEASKTDYQLIENFYKVAATAKKDQNIIVSYEFNSKAHTKLKVIKQFVSRECAKSIKKINYHLVRLGKKKKVIASRVNVLSEYDLERNTDYAYQVISQPENCKNYEIGAVVWLGKHKEEPVEVRGCVLKQKTKKAHDINYLVNFTEPITVYANNSKKFFGKKSICGKTVKYKTINLKKDLATATVHGDFVSNSKKNYSFEINFLDNLKNGNIICTEDQKVFYYGQLSNCFDKVMDGRDFK